MRIISGFHKNRKINAPKSLPVRPTTDLAKESLFNIINNTYNIKILNVLDLFSGTGNISYEFASRGANKIISIDNNFNCIKFIKKTSAKLLLNNIECKKMDSIKYLNLTKEKFDIIFADAPYSYQFLDLIIIKIFNNNLLNENGTLILEHSDKNNFINSKYFLNKKKYSSVNFSFFVNNRN